MNDLSTLKVAPVVTTKKPRIGFLGAGWIGRARLTAVAESELAEIVGVCDPAVPPDHPNHVPGVPWVATLDELLASEVDGIVIATPNAFHASQSIAALEAGKAVFCQKPLGRDAAEAREVVSAARKANRLLGVDLSYRYTSGMRSIRNLIKQGELGSIYAIEAKFHNAYGPDKPWFYDPKLSGGGCLLDLGVHLIDLALWCLDEAHVVETHGNLLSAGKTWTENSGKVEDYATAQIRLSSGAVIQLSCSWRAPAGCEADIGVTFFGDKGGCSFRNLNGSFYDFMAEHFLLDRSRRVLAEPPDQWGAGAILNWVRRLAYSPTFDPSCKELVTVAETIDQIYGRDE